MSLQKRLVFFILIPVTVLLLSMGWVGFKFAKDSLLKQWAEASTLKLQRAAHFVDMQLARPKELLKMFQQTGNIPHGNHIRSLILERLRAVDGIVRVEVSLNTEDPDRPSSAPMPPGSMREHHRMMLKDPLDMPFHRAGALDVTPPRYDPSSDNQTVSVISDLKDAGDRSIGYIEVVIAFDTLVNAIEATGWWRSHKAFIIDENGRILTTNSPRESGDFAAEGNSLEQSTLDEMKTMPFGTIFGSGFPPKEIAGFYKLHEAPWSLVIIAPGDEVLAPIIQFQGIYLITGVVFIFIILVLIRFVAGKVVSSIRDVSKAADDIAKGQYGIELPVKSRDEIGDLFQSFNRMVVQLEERARIKTSLNLAMDVQQNLLPRKSLRFDSLDIAGLSVYCDEIGGDYYDFFQVPAWGDDQVGVAIGDVSGHGVPAALLMATARALIRSSVEKGRRIADIITDTNRLLCRDTESSGHFMTLFLMLFDTDRKEIRWVRAGHDPAMLYNPADDSFTELLGDGMGLGVDDAHRYAESVYSGFSGGQIVIACTDGVWEAEGDGGRRFGKERLMETIRRHRDKTSGEIMQAITDGVSAFRNGRAPEDDLTLVVIKHHGIHRKRGA